MTAPQESDAGPRLVRRRISLIVEYWKDPGAVRARDLADARTYVEASDLQLYRVLSVAAGEPAPVGYRPYELWFVGRPDSPGTPDWQVHDPTPHSGYRPPVFAGSHAECTRWVAAQGGTVVRR